MNDYIKAAVELADFNFPWDHYRQCIKYGEKITLTQLELDGLAAQLVRQVDALPVGKFPDDAPTHIYILKGVTDLWSAKNKISSFESSDRTMNTIKAIVDSKVLQEQE